MAKWILLIFSILCFGLAFSQDDGMDDPELLDLTGSDEESELFHEKHNPQLPKGPKHDMDLSKPTDYSCDCQCLTKGTYPKNTNSWPGRLVDGKCVCACKIPD